MQCFLNLRNVATIKHSSVGVTEVDEAHTDLPVSSGLQAPNHQKT